jgi:hypothetical protein
MTLSIGVVTNEHRRFTHTARVSELATEMKTFAKKLPGSVYAVDRRSDAQGRRTSAGRSRPPTSWKHARSHEYPLPGCCQMFSASIRERVPSAASGRAAPAAPARSASRRRAMRAGGAPGRRAAANPCTAPVPRHRRRTTPPPTCRARATAARGARSRAGAGKSAVAGDRYRGAGSAAQRKRLPVGACRGAGSQRPPMPADASRRRSRRSAAGRGRRLRHRTDPMRRAQRLARALVSDIVAYHPTAVEGARRGHAAWRFPGRDPEELGGVRRAGRRWSARSRPVFPRGAERDPRAGPARVLSGTFSVPVRCCGGEPPRVFRCTVAHTYPSTLLGGRPACWTAPVITERSDEHGACEQLNLCRERVRALGGYL